MAETNYNNVQGKLEEVQANTANGEPLPPSKIIKGEAKVEKRTAAKKFVDFLFSDKLDSIGSYLTYDVLKPALHNLVYQLGLGALQMALFGNGRPPVGPVPPSQQYSGARRDYGAYSQPQGYGYATPVPPPQPVMAPGYRSRIMPNDISFETADDASLVLQRMRNEIMKYGKVFLRHFYEFSGITGQMDNWTLGSYGWYNLDTATIFQRTIDGRWMINFPDPQMIR